MTSKSKSKRELQAETNAKSNNSLFEKHMAAKKKRLHSEIEEKEEVKESETLIPIPLKRTKMANARVAPHFEKVLERFEDIVVDNALKNSAGTVSMYMHPSYESRDNVDVTLAKFDDERLPTVLMFYPPKNDSLLGTIEMTVPLERQRYFLNHVDEWSKQEILRQDRAIHALNRNYPPAKTLQTWHKPTLRPPLNEGGMMTIRLPLMLGCNLYYTENDPKDKHICMKKVDVSIFEREKFLRVVPAFDYTSVWIGPNGSNNASTVKRGKTLNLFPATETDKIEFKQGCAPVSVEAPQNVTLEYIDSDSEENDTNSNQTATGSYSVDYVP
jgi:hypothetical protein